MPSPITVKKSSVSPEERCLSKAKPRAAPRPGAVQGVATAVARTPEKKAPAEPPLPSALAAVPARLVPISKTPARLRPSVTMSTQVARTKPGDCI